MVYAGRTGTGFTQATHRLLRDRLEKLKRATNPFADVPPNYKRGAHWVEPELVAQISFSNWTADNLMRQASFKGLREDKPPREVVREDPAEVDTGSSMRKKSSGDAASSTPATSSKRAIIHRTKKQAGVESATGSDTPIRLTHPDKVLDPDTGVTKRQLADYYLAVAERILPHIANRPLTLLRCPEGSSKPCFFQKHKNESLADEIGSVDVVDPKTGKSEPYITLSTARALAGLAQLGVLELHPWGSCNASLEKPDRIVFDLDPDTSISWETLAASAREVRKRLQKLGLKSYLKTTGGKGLHIVIPIRPANTWPVVKKFAHDFVIGMEKSNPALYVTTMAKKARTGKIYLDYLRNERGATSVAPYSPRARAGIPASLPLNWKELDEKEPPRFLLSDFAKWKSRLSRDPWKNWHTSQFLRGVEA